MTYQQTMRMKKRDIGHIAAIGFSIVFWAVIIGGMVWHLAAPRKSQVRWKVAEESKGAAPRHPLEERQSQFAATHGAVWPELMVRTDKSRLLSIDVQQRLMPGSPVAFDIWFSDVRDDRGTLVLTGTLLFSSVPVEAELAIELRWVEVVRSNRVGSLWVAAEIESVTPRREMRIAEGVTREKTVLHAGGRVLALQVPE